MTCLNGCFHDLYTESLAEALMRAEQGGAVAVWTSSGLTYPDQQHLMNQELIRQLLSSGKITIGQAAAKQKRPPEIRMSAGRGFSSEIQLLD